MTLWTTRLLRPTTPARKPRPTVSFRPRLEALEDRVVPALTYHGGLILNSVQAKAVYLGSDWGTNTTLQGQTSQFNDFLAKTVSGSYLTMLGADGFTGPNTVGGPKTAVGAGSFVGGAIDSPNPALQYTNLNGYNNRNPLASTAYTQTVLFDSQIETDLASLIGNGAPDSNSLYVVFVEPNVVVDFGNGQNSINAFGAYHSSFGLNGASVRYAVVPYAGSNGFLNNAGGYANSQAPWLSSFDSMTEVTTHETAETATDPDGNAWYDSSGNEIGDIVNGVTVYLNGYAVQRESAVPGSQYDFLAMTPQGATARPSSAGDVFAVQSGALYVNGVAVSGPTAATGHAENGGAVSVSAQGIDDFGQPMVDVVFKDGYAYEYHDFLSGNPTATGNPGFFPWTSLGGSVKQAAAGQGVSYVLLTNGNLGEYVDPNYATYHYGYGVNPGSRYGVIAGNVTAITAVGVDQVGVNAVEYVATVRGKSTTYEWRDVTAQSSSSPSGFTTISARHAAALELQAAQLALLTAGPVVFVTPPQGVAGETSVFSRASQPVIVLTARTSAPQPNRVDGGGSDSRLPDGQASDGSTALTPADAPTGPVNLSDVPVFGPLVREAGGHVKAVRSMMPAGLWQAVPVAPGAAKGTPESLAPAPNRLKGFAAGALALLGFAYVGLTSEERRRRPPRQ